MKYFLRIGLLVIVFGFGAARAADQVFLEPEQFNELGGWVVDQQFMDQMGSPYLLAHGLGDPVKDAVTTVTFPSAGRYRVWVRTRDWVAPWKAKGAPGRFQLLINRRALRETFGVEGAEWHWQDGGTATVETKTTVALHDLTGFEGRCDAILFTKDFKFRPPNELAALMKFRREALGLPEQPEDGGKFDLVVVGGGLAGCGAAVAAARLGLTVALVNDRPVLGGNGSSEVRVYPQGNINQKPYPRIGDVVAELLGPRLKGCGNRLGPECFADETKFQVVKAEKGITLLTEQRVNGVEVSGGVIRAVIAQHTRTARRVRLAGRWFADCTGDGEVGALAGADFETTRKGHMGASNLWHVDDALKCVCTDTNALNSAVAQTPKPSPFPRCSWAVDFGKKEFPGRKVDSEKPGRDPLKQLGEWFWESGFDRDPIKDVEWMRDLNFRAMYGAWDALKNTDKKYANYKLHWAAFVAGKRESRRLLGDVILTGEDFRSGKEFPDGCFPCSWGIDLHYPNKTYQKGHEGTEFLSVATGGKDYSYKGPYWAPYRTLYSRNIANLFMAGRDISVTHEALGPVRVMRTCGMMGEIVGMAASVCKHYDCQPRGVYAEHLNELKSVMQAGVGRLPEPVKN